jgi:xanthine dehydrogenase accessory factor
MESTVAQTPYGTAAGPGAAELAWAPVGQDWRDTALQLRLLLGCGISLAIATVVAARGTILRPGTVLAVTGAGTTIGFNPAGPLDGAIRDLAAEALATGQDRLEYLRIDADAASYIGLSGEISLQVHAMRVPATDPASAAALRHLDSGAAAVLVIGTGGLTGMAVVGADRVTGPPGCRGLPPAVIQDARCMLGSRQTASRAYVLDGQANGTGIRVWMASYPES